MRLLIWILGQLGGVNLSTFVISSDGTFDVAASAPQLGPAALSIRGASVHLKRTASGVSLALEGGQLFFALGQPVNLPDLSLSTTATIDQPFTFGLDFGALFSVSSAQYRFRITSDGVIHLDLVDIPNSTRTTTVSHPGG